MLARGGLAEKHMTMPFDTLDDASDDALLARYATGDASAARALTLRFTPKVFAQAYRMLGDRADAEDVTQEAMLRLWRMAPDWQPGQARVTTWLFRVTSNLATDRLRRNRGTAIDDVAEPQDPAPGQEEQMQNSARLDAIRAALATLPERQRLALTLRHFEGLSNPDIAAQLEISIEAVESLTARAKRALARALAPQKAALGYTDD